MLRNSPPPRMNATTLDRFRDWGLLGLRVVIGIIFIYHGTQKWGLWQAVPQGMPPSISLLMKFLSIVEPIGGLAVIVGVLTRWAALGLAIIMAGAIYFKINVMNVGFAPQNATGWEFDLVLLAANLAIATVGAGCLALDCPLCRTRMSGKKE